MPSATIQLLKSELLNGSMHFCSEVELGTGGVSLLLLLLLLLLLSSSSLLLLLSSSLLLLKVNTEVLGMTSFSGYLQWILISDVFCFVFYPIGIRGTGSI